MAMTCSAFGCTWLAKEALSREKVERFGSTASSTKEKAFEKVELQASMADIFMTFSQVNLQMIFDVADVHLYICNIEDNVHRSHDARTRGLHALCASQRCLQLSSDESRLNRQIVMNFAVWRLIGGTTAFASEVGFFWPTGGKKKKDEKRVIRGIIQRAYYAEANPDFADKCICLASQDASCSSKSESKHWHA